MSLRIRTAPFVVRRANSMARGSSRLGKAVRGFTLVELLVVISIIGMLMAMLLPAIQQARETGFQNTCRNNLSNLAKALFSYGNRNGGRLPGYMNLLKTKRGLPYKDPITQVNTPVSWAVEILSDIDRQSTYEQWQKDLTDPNAGSGGGSTGTQQNFLVSTQLYVDLFICPSDPASQKTGTPISYVVNTGQQDLVSSKPATAASGSGSNAQAATKGMPRDWQANGMFFDNYSDDPNIKTTNTSRGPMVYMRMELCRDPKDKTILLTENVDAENYTYDSNGPGGTTFTNAEVMTGCIYAPGPVTNTTATPPTMDPVLSSTSGGGSSGGGSGGGSGGSSSGSSDVDNFRINSAIGRGDGLDYTFCRPSARHPQGVNIAYVGQNVQFLRDNVAYFVFAKLMSSEDMQMKLPGTNTQCDPVLRQYQLNDSEINP